MPGTWAEARAAKDERLRREHRHYTPDLLGPPCNGGCGLKMPLALINAGVLTHPGCSQEARELGIGLYKPRTAPPPTQ